MSERKEFYCQQKSMRLSAFLGEVCPEISYTYLRTLLRMRDIKVNDKRVNQDVVVRPGDCVQVYVQTHKLYHFVPDVVYEDAQYRFFCKPRGISSESYAEKAEEYYNQSCLLCHRLDTNTQGILMTARNKSAQQRMADAIKHGWVKKYYLALLGGSLQGECELVHWLIKDADLATVRIFDAPQKGASKVITRLRPLEQREDVTKVEVEIQTGKTHQIRAQTAHIGHPVLGDPKYGDYDLNRRYKAKKQYLTAYKLCFLPPEGESLGALDGRTFCVTPDFD